MNKQQEPRLRFKGFTDAWEEKVLGEVTEYLSDGTHFSPKSQNGEYKYITSKNIRNSGLDLSDVLIFQLKSIKKYINVVQSNLEICY